MNQVTRVCSWGFALHLGLVGGGVLSSRRGVSITIPGYFSQVNTYVPYQEQGSKLQRHQSFTDRLILPPGCPRSNHANDAELFPCASLSVALGGDACLVCGSLSGQCQEWRHHVRPVGHRDPTGDRHQQCPAQAQAPPGHPGDGVPDEPLSSPYLQDGE